MMLFSLFILTIQCRKLILGTRPHTKYSYIACIQIQFATIYTFIYVINHKHMNHEHITFVLVLLLLLEITSPEHGCILWYPGEGSLVVVTLHVHPIVIKPPVMGVPNIPVPKIFIIHIDIDITGHLTIQVPVFLF